MKYMFKLGVLAAFAAILAPACKKLDRPALGDYPVDANPPGGPLKFYAAFDGTGTSASLNAVDSIRANFPSDNPLTSVDGVRGKAVQGVDGKAINFPSANDFKNATSFTISFWAKRAINTRTEFYFSLKDDSYGWSHSSIFMMIEHATATDATVKVGLMDQWLEFAGGNKMKRPIFDGNWHHWALVYDETTSKLSYYFDGAIVSEAPPQATDVKKDGNPRGKLDLTQSNNLIIGGWNKHAGQTGPTDDWVGSFGGALDQFRMYDKVMTAAEIAALYNAKM